MLHFGSAYLKERVARPCLEGSKRIALAISEPYAGVHWACNALRGWGDALAHAAPCHVSKVA